LKMKKSLGRAFIYSLIALFIMVFLFTVISYALNDDMYILIDSITAYPFLIIYHLTKAFTFFPWYLIELISVGTGYMLYYIGVFVALIIASIIAGISGGDIPKSLGGWILTSICCIVLLMAGAYVEAMVKQYICATCTVEEAIVDVLITGATNLLIFGGVTLIVAAIVGKS